MYLPKILGPQNNYTYSLTPLHSLFIFLPLPEPLVHFSLKKQVGMMSIGSGSGRSSNNNYNNKNRSVVGNHPPACFSASQWQQLEHQALVFKYMVSGIPIPPDLLTTSCPLLHNNDTQQHTHLIGSWNRFEMGRKIDQEPGRCRRTDGKKWRCSKEAYPDSKYCERHMHRGRNRSTGTSTSSRKQQHITPSPPPNPNPNPIIKNTLPHFLSKYTSGFSSQQDINFHFLHPNMVRSGFSSTDRNDTDSSSSTLTMALMGNSSLFPHAKHNISTPYSAVGRGHEIIKHDQNQQHQQQPEKVVMHHFLDERSTLDEQGLVSDRTTQLSISIPNYLHDFFVTQKCLRSLNQWENRAH